MTYITLSLGLSCARCTVRMDLFKVVIFNWQGFPNKATMLDRLGMMTKAARSVDRSQREGMISEGAIV